VSGGRLPPENLYLFTAWVQDFAWSIFCWLWLRRRQFQEHRCGGRGPPLPSVRPLKMTALTRSVDRANDRYGQQRHLGDVRSMSALVLNSGHKSASQQVSRSAISGRKQSQQTNSLLNHLVGAREQRLRNVEAERLGCLEIYCQFELGRMLDRQVGGLVTL
jgi:hypothetical protein